MRIQYNPIPLTWRSFSINGGTHRAAENALLRRMARIFAEWEGTPYRTGQHVKQVGTFCTAFVAAVLDELYRLDRPVPLPEIPPDASFHHSGTARAGLRWFLRQYPNHEPIPIGGEVQPGDVLVTGPGGGGPGHGILVGPAENTIWQCSGGSVHFTGFALPEPYILYAAYRLTDRMLWL